MSLLKVTDLSVYFHTRNGILKAVDGVSFAVEAGKTFAIIGESGSGKTVACYSMLGLVPMPPGKIESGSVQFEGRDLLSLSERELRHVRGKGISIIFQDPMTSLNPFLKIGDQLIEPLRLHFPISKKAAWQKGIEILEEVGIKDAAQRMHSWPFEFSGGMRQRVVIAMALVTEPKIIIADEPTTALDVTVQAQILKLLKELQSNRNIGVIFISHDLSVVADIADQMAVMQEGRFVEQGSRDVVFNNPQHDYTRKLLGAVPNSEKPEPDLSTEQNLVEVESIHIHFPASQGGGPIKAVDDVSLDIKPHEILGLVGESGSGKSTLGRAIIRLLNLTSGTVKFAGQDISKMSAAELKPLRRQMQIIFQDPYASLNPRMTVYDTLAEPLRLHKIVTKKELDGEICSLMDSVGLARESILRYPHEFSGGQRQRIAIGRAIATKPAFIIADEPVSSLDVTIQAQILDLLLQLVERFNLTMLFISHDLGVVRYLADRILVMNEGKLVESGSTHQVFNSPQQAYTQALLNAIPGKSIFQE
ncbi:MAG: dipeptide ABC transporter ATP-binding protein [Gammaproteobacteria bacterium]|jgi:ABC-type microcin C transport system duplicated ATPase subunit YejF|nr:dipeptide ABC transporter ATP-binding protein [Gammaproteobacteria bacterium]